MKWRKYGDPLFVKRAPKPPHCTIDDCTKPVYAREWCKAHYSQWKKKGEPATFEIIIDTLSDRAWFRLETSFTDGWELKLTTQSARSNQAIDVRFDQTDSYEMDPMIVFDIPDHSRVEVYRDE